MFKHLVQSDGDSAEKHREFYDEYLAVMDLTAEYFLQTVEKVFVNHELPKGEMMHRDKPVDLLAIRRCAIMAVEGEKDDISGLGQTLAALDLTPNLPSDKKVYHLQEGVGHYGVFNGKRFRSEIAPRIAEFIEKAGRSAASARRQLYVRNHKRVLESHRWPILMTERIMEEVGHGAALQAVRERRVGQERVDARPAALLVQELRPELH